MREGDERVREQSVEEEEEWAAIFTALYREPLWRTAIHLNTLRHRERRYSICVCLFSLSSHPLYCVLIPAHHACHRVKTVTLCWSLISLPICFYFPFFDCNRSFLCCFMCAFFFVLVLIVLFYLFLNGLLFS